MKQISFGQMVMLLLISRIFKMITYNPFEYTSAKNLMIELIISAALQCILVAPFIYIYNYYPGESVISLARKKSKAFGNTLGALYAIYFFLISLRAVKYFTVFMSQMFPGIHYSTVIAVILTIVAGYGALLGIESVGRSASVVFVFVIVMILSILFTSGTNIDVLNMSYQPQQQNIGLWGFLYRGLGYNVEIVTIAVLMPYVKNRLPSGLFSYIGIKLVIAELIAFLCVSVLGQFAEYSKLPVFKLGAYTKTQFFERFDALYMTIWVLTAVICIAYYIWLVTASIKHISVKPATNCCTLIVVGIIIAMNIFFKIEKSGADIWFDKYMGTVIVCVLSLILPSIVIFINRNKEGRSA